MDHPSSTGGRLKAAWLKYLPVYMQDCVVPDLDLIRVYHKILEV